MEDLRGERACDFCRVMIMLRCNRRQEQETSKFTRKTNEWATSALLLRRKLTSQEGEGWRQTFGFFALFATKIKTYGWISQMTDRAHMSLWYWSAYHGSSSSITPLVNKYIVLLIIVSRDARCRSVILRWSLSLNFYCKVYQTLCQLVSLLFIDPPIFVICCFPFGHLWRFSRFYLSANTNLIPSFHSDYYYEHHSPFPT